MPPTGVKPPYIHDWKAAAKEPVTHFQLKGISTNGKSPMIKYKDGYYTWHDPDWTKSQAEKNDHYHREGNPPGCDDSQDVCD